jgi:hypothetical protein
VTYDSVSDIRIAYFHSPRFNDLPRTVGEDDSLLVVVTGHTLVPVTIVRDDRIVPLQAGMGYVIFSENPDTSLTYEGLVNGWSSPLFIVTDDTRYARYKDMKLWALEIAIVPN